MTPAEAAKPAQTKIMDTTKSPTELAAVPCSAFLRTINGDLYTKQAFTALDDCCEQGQAASSQGYRRDQNPYPKGTAEREWWDGGYFNETDELTGEA